MLEVTPSVCQRHRQERYLCLPGSDIPAPRTRSPRLPVPPLSPRQPEGRRNQGQLSQDPGKCQRAISHSPGPPPWARPSCNAGPFPLSDSPSPGPEHMLHGGHTGALPWGSSVPWGPCRTSRDMCHLLRAVPRPPGQDSMTSLSWELSQNPRSQQTPTGPWGTGCCPVHGADRRSPHPPHTHTHSRWVGPGKPSGSHKPGHPRSNCPNRSWCLLGAGWRSGDCVSWPQGPLLLPAPGSSHPP